MNKADFDGAVTRAMKGNDRDINAIYSINPGAGARDGYYAVVVFNPPAGIDFGSVCQSPQSIKPADKSGSLRVLLVFCEPTPFAAARGVATNVNSVDDAGFKRLIGDLTYAAVPRQPPPQLD